MCETSAAPSELSSTVRPSAISSTAMMFGCDLARMRSLPEAWALRLSFLYPYLDHWHLPDFRNRRECWIETSASPQRVIASSQELMRRREPAACAVTVEIAVVVR